VKYRHRQQRRRIVMQKVDTVYTQKMVARFNRSSRRVINRRVFSEVIA